jgi:hydroxymethylpyrimidine/phosphomethylpyrimidine kinase
LAIGGLDPSGGAGLPADARAMMAFGAHCCGITTAVIAQNTRGVAIIEPVSLAILEAQLEVLLSDVTPRAVKIGMLPGVEAVEVVEKWIRTLDGIPLIVDTVFAPTQGHRFCDAETIRAITERLLPLADVVTPNIPEAVQLSGSSITDRESLAAAARYIQHTLRRAPCTLERRPLAGSRQRVKIPMRQLIRFSMGKQFVDLRAPRVIGYEVRGTGCLLASAIAAQRSHGVAIEDAARNAKAWLTGQIQNAKVIGQGRRVASYRET